MEQNSSIAFCNASKQLDDQNQMSMYIYEMDKAINLSRRQQQEKLKDKSLLQIQDESARMVRNRQPSYEDVQLVVAAQTTRE